MTDKAHYAALVESVFGTGTVTFDASAPGSNNVIGALAHATQFKLFQANFIARLRRLSAAIDLDATLREDVLIAVNNVSTDEWDGMYAELCALDYFLATPATGPGQMQLSRDVPASETLASEMGMQSANHDMRLTGLAVSMDTKNLSDKTDQILEGIFKEFRAAKGINYLPIVPTYALDDDYVPFRDNRRKLLDELLNCVNPKARPADFASSVIPGLSYQFAWEPGAYTSVSSYSPIEHAKQHHRLLFGHAKKFSRVEPTVIVYVMFPWSGERVFLFNKQEFQTEFCTRFFDGYIGSSIAAKSLYGKIKTAISAEEVTKYLSGVIFLDDASITAEDPDAINVEASFRWNQNAVNPLMGHALDIELRRRGAIDLTAV